MRILIADKLSSKLQNSLKTIDCQITIDPNLKDDDLYEAIVETDPQVLVVRSTKVQKRHLSTGRSLSLVIRAGAGVNTIDIDTASQWGIYVANCPGKNAVAVAELTFGHILNADRRIADNVSALRAGQWKKKIFSKGCLGLKSRTLGLIGMGNIGQEVAHRAHSFEMKVLGWDPFVEEAQMATYGVQKVDTLSAMVAQVDVLSVHLPLNDQTRGMIGADLFEVMKEGAIFVNTSRGEVVDESALLEAAQQRGIRVGLDVFCKEPSTDGAWTKDLAQLSGVYGTHHIGASTEQSSEAVGDEVFQIIKTWISTGAVLNCVNLAHQSHASHLLVVRHADEVGVLAEVLDTLRRADINVQEMENIVFKGALAACARIQVNKPPSVELMNELERSVRIFAVDLISLN